MSELYEATIIRVCNIIWYVRPRRETVHCCGVGLSRVWVQRRERLSRVSTQEKEIQVVGRKQVATTLRLSFNGDGDKLQQTRVGSAQQQEHPGGMTGLHGHQAPENMQVIS